MIPLSVVRLVDYVVFGIAGLCALLCLLAALFVVPCTGAIRGRPLARHFNKYWKTRVVMELTAALWLLSQWLRLGGLWLPGSRIFPDSVPIWTRNGIFCRVYLTLALGLLQPFFLLLILLLCLSTLSRKRQQDGGWSNATVVGGAFLLSIPLLLMQAVVAWLGMFLPAGHPGAWEDHPGTLLHYFFAAYSPVPTRLCRGRKGCTLCSFPAASCIISLVSSVVYVVVIWRVTELMIKAAVNRRLQLRLRIFQLSIILVLALNQATLGASVATSSLEWAFQVTWLAYFLTLPLLVTIVSVLLVIIPVWDAWVSTWKLPVSTPAEVAKPEQELAFWTKEKLPEDDLETPPNGKTAALVADAT
eukprot:jgi/Botrbrau1/15868/Bobra.40_1s0052.1